MERFHIVKYTDWFDVARTITTNRDIDDVVSYILSSTGKLSAKLFSQSGSRPNSSIR